MSIIIFQQTKPACSVSWSFTATKPWFNIKHHFHIQYGIMHINSIANCINSWRNFILHNHHLLCYYNTLHKKMFHLCTSIIEFGQGVQCSPLGVEPYFLFMISGSLRQSNDWRLLVAMMYDFLCIYWVQQYAFNAYNRWQTLWYYSLSLWANEDNILQVNTGSSWLKL